MTRGIGLIGRRALRFVTFGSVLALSSAAWAQAEDWQLYFGEPASPIMSDIYSFSNAVLIAITLITLFVLGLLAWVIIRYNSKANPVPSRTTHNSVVEVLWTVVPVLILVSIAIPSFGLLFDQYDPGRVIEDYDPAQAMTVKATGETWYWNYSYPDHGGLAFNSTPIQTANLREDDVRLLSVNNPLVVPVGRVIRVQVTANPMGVIHAFSLMAMGVKLDAVPGRITESWFQADREGIFFGQCSELCGRYHYFMPIEVRVVTAEQFEEWLAVVRTDRAAAHLLLDRWEQERMAAGQVAAR